MPFNPDAQSDVFVASDIIPVTPSDTVDLIKPSRAIRAQVGGAIRITTGAGMPRDTFIGDGEVLLVYASRVHATGTTADQIEAMI